MDVSFPEVTDLEAVPTGDMPGDKVQITPGHLAAARSIFPELWRQLEPVLAASPHHRAVVSVHGGSGVGKSETGALLAHGLNALGVGAYVLSGDNYPRRIPSANDAERLRTFRVGGVQGLVARHAYDDSVRAELVGPAGRRRRRRPPAGGRPPVAGHLPAGRTQGAGRLPRHAERGGLRRGQPHPRRLPRRCADPAAQAHGTHRGRPLVRRGGRLRHPGDRRRVDARQQRAPRRRRHPDPAEQHPGGDPGAPPRPQPGRRCRQPVHDDGARTRTGQAAPRRPPARRSSSPGPANCSTTTAT